MARPCKAMETTKGHFTRDEIQKRKEQEEKLKGLADDIKPPSFLSKEQRKIFKYIVKQLEIAGILGNLDVYILATCSIAIDRLQVIETKINEDINNLYNKDLMSTKDKYMKDFFRCCNELSLSPQSRAKLGNLNIQAQKESEDAVKLALQGVNEDDDI